MSDSGRILTNNSFTCPPPHLLTNPNTFFSSNYRPSGGCASLPRHPTAFHPPPRRLVTFTLLPSPPGTSLGLRPQVVYDSHATTPAILEKTARLTLLDAEGTRPFQRFSCGWCLGSRPPPPEGEVQGLVTPRI